MNISLGKVTLLAGLMIAQASAPLPRASVMVFDVKNDGFALTSKADGVAFDILGDGKKVDVAWTAAGSDEAFLVIDVDRNGTIDDGGELVGSRLRLQKNALPVSATEAMIFPLQGAALGPDGRGDRAILRGLQGAARLDGKDPLFGQLRLWSDRNHDGISQPSEIRTLADAAIGTILLGFDGIPSSYPDAFDGFGNRHYAVGTFMTTERGVEFQRKFREIGFAR